MKHLVYPSNHEGFNQTANGPKPVAGAVYSILLYATLHLVGFRERAQDEAVKQLPNLAEYSFYVNYITYLTLFS